MKRYKLETRHHELSGFEGDTDLWEDDDGDWVKYSDYDQLRTKVKEFEKALHSIRNRLGDFKEPCNQRERDIDDIALEAIQKGDELC